MNLLRRLKAIVETPETGAATATLQLTDIVVLTYAVPVERVAPLLPCGFVADVLPDSEGNPRAFVQIMCAFVEEARWSPAPKGSGEAYREITYRVLGRVDKTKPGAYLLRSFYTADGMYLAQRALHKNADFARASVHISGDPVRGVFDGYQLRTTADRGTTEWELVAADTDVVPAPFGTLADMTRFLMRRESVYFAPSAAPSGWQGHAPVAFPAEMPAPTLVKLVSARLTPWREWGVLSVEDALAPQSALYVPSLTVTAYPPRPARIP